MTYQQNYQYGSTYPQQPPPPPGGYNAGPPGGYQNPPQPGYAPYTQQPQPQPYYQQQTTQTVRARRLANKLHTQRYVVERLKTSLQKFYGVQDELVKEYEHKHLDIIYKEGKSQAERDQEAAEDCCLLACCCALLCCCLANQ